MTRENTNNICPADIASALECISINLKELTALLQLYDEHREDELAAVDPKEPCTVAVLITRQDMGLALIRTIEDKAAHILELATSATRRAYKLARSAKNTTAESEA